MKTKLMTVIEKAGQTYVDEAINVMPKPESEIALSVAHAFGRRLPEAVTVGHNRVRLRWMKPDGRGGLIPK